MTERVGRGVALNDLLRGLIEASPDFEGAVLVGQDGLVMAAAWPIEGQSDFDVGAIATRAFALSDQATVSVKSYSCMRKTFAFISRAAQTFTTSFRTMRLNSVWSENRMLEWNPLERLMALVGMAAQAAW